MTWTLPEPMLTTPVASPGLQPGWAAEPNGAVLQTLRCVSWR